MNEAREDLVLLGMVAVCAVLMWRGIDSAIHDLFIGGCAILLRGFAAKKRKTGRRA